MKQKIEKLFTMNYQPTAMSQRGFTLIELAMVLVVIGIVIALGAGLIGPLTKRAKYTETKEIVNAAVESVISYAAANNRIPTITEFPNVVRTPRDAWTKDLYYIPDANLDDLLAGGVCGRKTTGITVRECTNATCTSYKDIPNVAFVVISGSENYNIQTNTIGGIVTVYEAGTPNIDNCTDANDCPTAATEGQDPDIQEEYDDIVKWVTLDELRIKAGCVGAQLKILNNELPYGFQNNPYTATIYADGGVPFPSGGYYKWCLKGALPSGISNPTPGCPTTNSCASLANDETTGWTQNNSLEISGTPTTSGNFNITILVRDNNDNNTADNKDNCAQRSFAMTINPEAAAPDACADSGIDVRNETGPGPADRGYKVNGGACQEWKKNDDITVTSGNTYDIYSDKGCGGSPSCTTTYTAQKGYDSDADCKTRMTSLCTFADR